MPPKHRKLGTGRFLVIALAGLGGLAGPAGAATPAFQEAPGRVVFAVDTAAQNQSTAASAVALPNGGVVIGGSGTPGPQTLVTDPHDTSYAAQLEPAGQLDPSFGHGGIAEIPGIYPARMRSFANATASCLWSAPTPKPPPRSRGSPASTPTAVLTPASGPAG